MEPVPQAFYLADYLPNVLQVYFALINLADLHSILVLKYPSLVDLTKHYVQMDFAQSAVKE